MKHSPERRESIELGFASDLVVCCNVKLVQFFVSKNTVYIVNSKRIFYNLHIKYPFTIYHINCILTNKKLYQLDVTTNN